jgi:hypothetical protein
MDGWISFPRRRLSSVDAEIDSCSQITDLRSNCQWPRRLPMDAALNAFQPLTANSGDIHAENENCPAHLCGDESRPKIRMIQKPVG